MDIVKYEHERWLGALRNGPLGAYELTKRVQQKAPRFQYLGMKGKTYCEDLMTTLVSKGWIKHTNAGLTLTDLGRQVFHQYRNQRWEDRGI